MAAIGSPPNSSFTGYCAAADLVAHRDYRQWADLVNDDNTRLADAAAVTTNASTTDGVLYRAIRWASGMIEAAVTTGNRYRPEDLLELFDLQTIPAVQGGNGSTTGYTVGRDLLVGLCVDLAYWWATKRRFPGKKPEDVSGAEEALELLERLRIGERIFPIAATQDAGLAEVTPIDFETNVRDSADPITVRAGRFFGSRR